MDATGIYNYAIKIHKTQINRWLHTTHYKSSASPSDFFFAKHHIPHALRLLLPAFSHTRYSAKPNNHRLPACHSPTLFVAPLMSLFVIVGKNEPVFEADFSTSTTGTSGKVRPSLVLLPE